VEDEINSGALVKVEVNGLPALKRETSLIYRTDRYLSAAARGFVEILTQHYHPGEP
jgi:DNA-binding transcriptional LysR family regulator